MRRLIRLSLATGAVTALTGGLLAIAERGSAVVPTSSLTAPEPARALAETPAPPTPAPTPAPPTPTPAGADAAAKYYSRRSWGSVIGGVGWWCAQARRR